MERWIWAFHSFTRGISDPKRIKGDIRDEKGDIVSAWVSEYDARLICAAPELLKWAKIALPCMEDSAHVEQQELRDVIARAEGLK